MSGNSIGLHEEMSSTHAYLDPWLMFILDK